MSRYSKPIDERVTRLLCDLLEQGQTVFRTADAGDLDALGVLRGLGIVLHAGKVQSVTCLECDGLHPAVVEVDEATGRSGWYCPEYGFIEAKQTEIAGDRLNCDRLVQMFADSIEARGRRKPALIDGLLWRVGKFEFADETIQVHLAAGGLAADDLSRIATALDSEPLSSESIVLIGGSQDFPGLQLAKGRRPLLLRDVLDTTSNRIGLSRKAIAGAVGLGAPDRERPRGGRPSGFEATHSVVQVLERSEDWRSIGTNEKVRRIEAFWPELNPASPSQKERRSSTI